MYGTLVLHLSLLQKSGGSGKKGVTIVYSYTGTIIVTPSLTKRLSIYRDLRPMRWIDCFRPAPARHRIFPPLSSFDKAADYKI